jgi:hypothetical protein
MVKIFFKCFWAGLFISQFFLQAVQRAPVLSNFRKAWPVDEILKQWLSYISNSIKKDFLAEAEDEEEPDRDAVKKYLESLSLSRGGKAADSDSEVSGSDLDIEIDEIRKELAEGNGDSDVEDEQASKASKKRKGRRNVVDDAPVYATLIYHILVPAHGPDICTAVTAHHPNFKSPAVCSRGCRGRVGYVCRSG